MAASRAETVLGQPHAARAFEAEGLGDHRDGQRVQFLGERRDHRRRAGAGAAAQSGGDEDHVRALQHFDDAIGIFERGLPADLGVRAGAEAVGDLGAELQFVGHLARGRAPAMSVFMA